MQAGIQLKKVKPALEKPEAPPSEPGGAPFVPNPADLLKLKAGLRKTAAPEIPEPLVEASAQDAAAAQAPPQENAVPQAQPANGSGGAAVLQEAQPMDTDAPALVGEPAIVGPAADEQPAPGQTVCAEQPATAEEAWDEPVAAQRSVAEACAAAQPSVAEPAASEVLRKRKSVRFQVEQGAAARVAGTPEGAARDATITIRLRKGDVEQVRRGTGRPRSRSQQHAWPRFAERGFVLGRCRLAATPTPTPSPRTPLPQIINVDDNTVAFAQWGLGTQGDLEDLPDTVVSKRSRHSAAPPPSAGKTPSERGGARVRGGWCGVGAAAWLQRQICRVSLSQALLRSPPRSPQRPARAAGSRITRH
jgi:hypothetical protein